jgi:hypothetical protein
MQWLRLLGDVHVKILEKVICTFQAHALKVRQP